LVTCLIFNFAQVDNPRHFEFCKRMHLDTVLTLGAGWASEVLFRRWLKPN
jgi:hypothetical protein